MKNSVADYYDQYSVRQLRIGINERHRSILTKSIAHGLNKYHRVLEIGCGIGTVTELLSNYLKEGNVTGLDLSAKSIEIAKKRLKNRPNVKLEAKNIIEEELDEVFDAIILPDVLEHIPLADHEVLFRILVKCLKDEGSIFIHIPNPNYLRWCHVNRPDLLQIIDQPIYSNILLEKIYKCGLNLHFLETYSIWIDNCDYQFIVLKKDITKNFSAVKDRASHWDKLMFKIMGVFSK